MSHLKKFLLFSALAVASLSAVSSAGAATATITGGPGVSGATGGTALRLHTAAVSLSCTSGGATGTVAASTSGAFGLRVGTITPSFSNCSVTGGIAITVACQPAALLVTAPTTAGHTPGAITGISCHIFRTAQTNCRVTVAGQVGARVTNGPPASISVDQFHTNLLATSSTNGSGASCAVLPNDTSARFFSTSAGNPDTVYSVTPTNLSVSVVN